MNKDKIKELMSSTEEDVAFVKQLSEAIVAEHTTQLDNLMCEIHTKIIDADDVPDQLIEYYFGQLSSALYFLEPQHSEEQGFYEDITKANARLKYNEAYAENQLNNIGSVKKPTQNDNQLYAEMNSVDEQTLNLIYSRSARIIRCKFENAHEMLRTLSKISSLRNNYKFIGNSNV